MPEGFIHFFGLEYIFFSFSVHSNTTSKRIELESPTTFQIKDNFEEFSTVQVSIFLELNMCQNTFFFLVIVDPDIMSNSH